MLLRICLLAIALGASHSFAAEDYENSTPPTCSTPRTPTREEQEEKQTAYYLAQEVPAEFITILATPFADKSQLTAEQMQQIIDCTRLSVYRKPYCLEEPYPESLQFPITGRFALHLWSLALTGQGSRRPEDIDIEGRQDDFYFSRVLPYFKPPLKLSGIHDGLRFVPKNPSDYVLELGTHERKPQRLPSVNLFGMAVRPLPAILAGKIAYLTEIEFAGYGGTETLDRFGENERARIIRYLYDIKLIKKLQTLLDNKK